jgi:hypothetical protein
MPPVDAPFWARPFEPWPISDHEIRDTSERRVELWHASPPALPPPPPPPSPPLPPQPPQPPSLPSLSNGRIFPQQPHRALDETAATWPSGGTCTSPARRACKCSPRRASPPSPLGTCAWPPSTQADACKCSPRRPPPPLGTCAWPTPTQADVLANVLLARHLEVVSIGCACKCSPRRPLPSARHLEVVRIGCACKCSPRRFAPWAGAATARSRPCCRRAGCACMQSIST